MTLHLAGGGACRLCVVVKYRRLVDRYWSRFISQLEFVICVC